MTEAEPMAAPLATLRARFAEKGIDQSLIGRELVSQDIGTVGTTCLAVLRPQSTEELAAMVAASTASGLAVFPRGAGLSYTGGYLPDRTAAVVVDMSAMDRIVAIDRVDMHVTVEAGVTWAALDAALRPLGLRTPFWGALSGVASTVGGAMSQNAVWWGSGLYGTATESALAMDVVLADGSIVSTGSAGGTAATPFARTYGPDLTGLFGHDAGALGIKARITLKLIPRPTANRFVSHSFATAEAAFAAMSQVAREQLASENFGFDPALNAINVVEGDGDLGRDLGRLVKVMRSDGLAGAARVAMAGRRFAKAIDFGHHAIVEDRSEAGAEVRLRRIRRICADHGGREVAPSVPRIALADPFPPVGPAVLRAKGERWLPRHAMVPHSRAVALLERFRAILADHAAAIERHGIRVGYLCCTVSTNIFLIEPQCIWPDSHGALHRRIVGETVAASLPEQPDNPAARAVIDAILDGFVAAAADLGAAHLQIGKAYPLRATRRPNTGALLDAVKRAVDPEHLMNPGALGL